jgi:hypothetical protein
MLRQILATIPLLMSLIPAVDAQAARVSVLIDFDPNSAAQTVIVESIAADPRGMLYACDRVTANVWQIDPKNPQLIAVGRVEERDIGGKISSLPPSGPVRFLLVQLLAAGSAYLDPELLIITASFTFFFGCTSFQVWTDRRLSPI